jgi:dienelactone hydrolase
MLEQHIDIPTRDGAMNTFVVHPEEHGPHPVVLFYMDAPGKREELHDMARWPRSATTLCCPISTTAAAATSG